MRHIADIYGKMDPSHVVKMGDACYCAAGLLGAGAPERPDGRHEFYLGKAMIAKCLIKQNPEKRMPDDFAVAHVERILREYGLGDKEKNSMTGTTNRFYLGYASNFMELTTGCLARWWRDAANIVDQKQGTEPCAQ